MCMLVISMMYAILRDHGEAGHVAKFGHTPFPAPFF